MPNLEAPNYQYPEDIPHVSGDRGTAALVVRKDVAASLADLDGDYSLLQVGSQGGLRTADNPGTLNNGIQIVVPVVPILLSAANANRKKLIVRNLGPQTVYVGTLLVTVLTGIPLNRDETLTLEMPNCPVNDIWAVDGGASSTVFVTEVT